MNDPISDPGERPPRIRPPFVGALYLLVAWGLDATLSGMRVIDGIWRWLGVVPILDGLAVIVWAIVLFRQRQTTHDVRETPTALVEAGPYRVTRNPMYWGVALILLGIGICVGTWPFLLTPLAFLLTMNSLYVPREERILERAIGQEYREYRKRVRRWL
ncbi:MAG TPA: isoprenylcysteine carboxylmethyltransferase family protein [Gemmatimonadota bacterium]|nr:isoprenylcysteine carboxylmethyltransferase family protein [Gemmatimonadota bacterium]